MFFLNTNGLRLSQCLKVSVHDEPLLERALLLTVPGTRPGVAPAVTVTVTVPDGVASSAVPAAAATGSCFATHQDLVPFGHFAQAESGALYSPELPPP